MFTVAAHPSQQSRDFPKGSLGPTRQQDEFKQTWYSTELKALQEPSLSAMAENRGAECYRFLWLRTFDHPIAVRLDVKPDGSGVLSTKIASGSAGFNAGELERSTITVIDRQQVNMFKGRVDQAGFWQLGPAGNIEGEDGSQWIIEGIKEGHYHLVDRWSPKGGGVRALGLTLAIELAHINLLKEEIY
jgi:hypothetical protein